VTATRARLSIVVPTTDGWPAVTEKLTSVRAAARHVNAELVVVDGSGNEPPADPPAGERWISSPGGSVFQLRLAGYRAAGGDVVAATEDHCIVPLDWGEAILRAHDEWPDAAVVVGAVTNASTDRAIEHAHFLVNLVAFTPPLPSGLHDGPICHVNLSYKRDALCGLDDNGGLGVADFLHAARLRRAGRRVYVDGRILTSHVQPVRALRSVTLQFHAARCVAAFQHRSMGPVQWLRVAAAPLSPVVRIARIARSCTAKGLRPEFNASAGWILLLMYAQAVGKLVGHVAGAGNSAHMLE
jgi:hypothetical protein